MEVLLLLGVAAAIFVGINIGGSSTGVAFGPSVGSKLVSKTNAAALMTIFALLGGWTVGRNVVNTMGGQIVPASQFSMTASIIILFFIGLSLLISNIFGVPASTSMTAVGAITGLGLASNTLYWETLGRIVSWWFVAPTVSFLVGGVIGRYLYPYLNEWFRIDQSDGPTFQLQRGLIPVKIGENASRREAVSSVLILVIACYMAFSAGASNVANAVAPLIGSQQVSMNMGILVAVGAMSLGGFTIARRTLDTVGDGITELPLLAALIVSTVSASIISVLSWMGIPASLAISATMCIAGLGWGRASRTITVKDRIQGKKPENINIGSLQTEGVEKIGEEKPEEIVDEQLFNPDTISRVVTLWILTPSISVVASYLVFNLIL